MEVTKEIYEKVVEICEGDYDLAHDVVMKLYDCENTSHSITTTIKILKKKVLEKKAKEPKMMCIGVDEEEFADFVMQICTYNELANLELKLLRETFLKLLKDSNISERNRSICVERFFDNKTFRELGKEYGVDPMRIWNITDKETRMLRTPQRAKYIKDFLFDSYFLNL